MLYRKLRGALIEKEIDQVYLAKKLGLNQPVSISKRMTGKVPWRINEMYAILDLLGVPYEMLPVYFPKDGRAPSGS